MGAASGMSFDLTFRGGAEQNAHLVFGARDRWPPVTDEAFSPGRRGYYGGDEKAFALSVRRSIVIGAA